MKAESPDKKSQPRFFFFFGFYGIRSYRSHFFWYNFLMTHELAAQIVLAAILNGDSERLDAHTSSIEIWSKSDPFDFEAGVFIACEDGKLDILKILLPYYKETNSRDILALAADANQIDVVRYLLPHVKKNKTRGLVFAALHDNMDMMDIFIELPSFDQVKHEAMRRAIIDRKKTAVLKLLPFFKDKDLISSCLFWAVQDADTRMVQTILPFAEPFGAGWPALLSASDQNLPDIYNLLLPLSDPRAAFSEMQKRPDGTTRPSLLRDTITRLNAEESKADLWDATAQNGHCLGSKVKKL